MVTWKPLSMPSVRAALAGRTLDVRLYDTLDSTMMEARRLVTAVAEETTFAQMPARMPPMLLATRCQTAGCGRLGRRFYSPPDSGLYMTLVYPLTQSAENAVAVTAGAAVATRQAVLALTGVSLDIKWVNDLYLHEKKVCGILTQAISGVGGMYLVVGIGVNLTTQAFPEGLRAPAGCISEDMEGGATETHGLDAGVLCGRIAAELWDMITSGTLTSSEVLARYRAASLLPGREVLYTRGDAFVAKVTAVAVTDDYGLRVRHADGREEVLYSGEVSVHLPS